MRKIFKIINGRLYYLYRVRRKKVASKATNRGGGKNLNYLKYKKEAVILVKERLEYFNQFYNLKWNRIAIRNQKTRWGSCSKKGNLNFNYKIALLPVNQADYIIVHELCHLEEFNHGKEFWNLVSITTPNYKEIRHSLRNNKLRLG